MRFSGQFSFKFSLKKIVKWAKNIVVPCLDVIMITFLPINNHWSSHFAQKACVNTEQVPPGHPMILLKSNKLNMAAVSVKRSIGHKNYFLVTSYNTSCDVVYNNREEKCDVRYNMVARFLDHNNLSWQRQHLHRQMMQERYRLYGLRWAIVLFLSAIRHRNVIHVNFFIFFCHICRTTVYWDPGILLARQSDVDNFSSLHQAKQHRCQPLHEECLFCSTFPYHSQPKPPPPLTTQPSP